jgi:ABC-type transporter Mla MlaB component
MALNFHIDRKREQNKLHLWLQGDFDGSSAMELVDELKNFSDLADTIYIHTQDISLVQPFGREVFLKTRPYYKRACEKLIFTGGWSRWIAPKNTKRVVE